MCELAEQYYLGMVLWELTSFFMKKIVFYSVSDCKHKKVDTQHNSCCFSEKKERKKKIKSKVL